jgi:hypothetical protein
VIVHDFVGTWVLAYVHAPSKQSRALVVVGVGKNMEMARANALGVVAGWRLTKSDDYTERDLNYLSVHIESSAPDVRVLSDDLGFNRVGVAFGVEESPPF